MCGCVNIVTVFIRASRPRRGTGLIRLTIPILTPKLLAESAREVAERALAAVNDLLEHDQNQHVLFVTHGGVIRLLRVLTEEMQFQDRMVEKVGNCSRWGFEIQAPLDELK